MTLDTLSFEITTLCAVCISDRSGAQIALLIILLSFAALGLINWSWRKYFKKRQR